MHLQHFTSLLARGAHVNFLQLCHHKKKCFNIFMHVPLWSNVRVSLGCIAWNGLAGSQEMSDCSSRWLLPSVVHHSFCIPVSLPTFQSFLIFPYLTGLMWYYIVVLTCISLWFLESVYTFLGFGCILDVFWGGVDDFYQIKDRHPILILVCYRSFVGAFW